MEYTIIDHIAKMSDDGYFKFGKYKDNLFTEVRKKNPSYFIWIWDNIGDRLADDLYKYIEINLENLEKEAEAKYDEFLYDTYDGVEIIKY